MPHRPWDDEPPSVEDLEPMPGSAWLLTRVPQSEHPVGVAPDGGLLWLDRVLPWYPSTWPK